MGRYVMKIKTFITVCLLGVAGIGFQGFVFAAMAPKTSPAPQFKIHKPAASPAKTHNIGKPTVKPLVKPQHIRLLPDLIVEKIWLNRGYIAFGLRNTGKGAIPDGEYQKGRLAVTCGGKTQTYAFTRHLNGNPPVDVKGTLKKPGESLSFTTGIKPAAGLKTSLVSVTVFADNTRQVHEQNERNNTKTVRLSVPHLRVAAKTGGKTALKPATQHAAPPCTWYLTGIDHGRHLLRPGGYFDFDTGLRVAARTNVHARLEGVRGRSLRTARLVPAKVRLPQLQVLKSIKVLSPNGGESWEKGEGYGVRWQSSGIRGNVKIMLKWGTSRGGWFRVTKSTPNTGSYFYKIPRREIGQEGNQFKIYVMTPDGSVKDESDGFFSITKKNVIHLHAPVFRFSFPKEGDTLQRGEQYSLNWRQIRDTSEDVSYVKILLQNRKKGQEFWITQGTPNKGFFRFTMPVMAEDGFYLFLIMPLNESFVNQSPEIIIGAGPDVSCEIRNAALVKHHESTFINYETIEFEIWIMYKGSGILSHVPVVYRLIEEDTNRVILQKEAGFGDVYPDRYYAGKIEIFENKFKGFDPSNIMIEVQVDPQNILHEVEIFRENNICRRDILAKH